MNSFLLKSSVSCFSSDCALFSVFVTPSISGLLGKLFTRADALSRLTI